MSNKRKLSNNYSFYKNIILLLLPYKSRVIFVFICIIVGSAIMAATPLVNRALIDQGIVALDFQMLLRMLGLTIFLFAIGRLVDVLEFWQLIKINRNFTFRLAFKAKNHLMKLPVSYFKDNQETQIINDLQMDIGKISLVTNRFMLVVIVQIFGVFGAIVGLAIIDPWLLLIVVAVVPVKFFIVRYFAKRHEKLMDKFIKLYGVYHGLYGDMIGNVEILKLWNLRRKKLRKLAHAHKDILRNDIQQSVNDKISETLDTLVGFLMNVAIYIVGFIGIANGRLTLGGLFAFMAYSAQIINPVSMIAQVQYYIADIKPSLKRHIDFLEISTEEDGVRGKIEKVEAPNKIIFSNVTLQYGDKVAIDGLDLKLTKGERVAIVGDNGSGKSSLIQLLLRLETPSSGDIYFDDTNITDIRIDNYRDMFAVVRQDVNLFDGSIRENIDLMGNSTDAEILSVFGYWGIEDLLESLPDGLDTDVGQEGSKLSGGEKQKVTVVRAGLKEASILILDEATANYDKDAEQAFNKALESKMDYDYVIIVTHQQDVLDKVDRIISLDEGRVANS